MSKIDKRISYGMTVQQLIEQLKNCNQDAVVAFQYPSGDYWHTQLAGVVRSIGVQTVQWSDYHDELKLQEDEEDENSREVVLIF